MKRIGLLSFTIFLTFFSCSVYGQLWLQYADSAQFYNSRKDPGKAIEFYLLAKNELKKDSLGTKTYLACINRLGGLYLNKGEYTKAEASFLEEMDLIDKLYAKKDSVYASGCFNLGLIYKKLNQYEKAEHFYLEAKKIREEIFGKNNLLYARVCNNLGNLYVDLSEYKKAEDLLLEAFQIRKNLVDEKDPAYSQSLLNLSALYGDMYQYQKELVFLLEAKRIREEVYGKESPEYAQCCDNLGLIYGKTGQYKKAEPFFIEARDVRAKVQTKSHPDYALACNHLALLYEETAEYEKAEPLFLEAKAGYENNNIENIEYSWNCDNLAEYYKGMGQHKKAEALLLKSKDIREKLLGKKDRWYAAACENLGNLYYDIGMDEKAEALYTESRLIKENSEFKDSLELSFSYSNLGNLYSTQKLYLKAASMYTLAERILQSTAGRLSTFYADNYSNLSKLYIEMGQYKKAEPICLEVKKTREIILGKNHPLYAESCLDMGNLCWMMNKPAEANDYYTESFQLQNIQEKKIFQFTSEAEKQSYLKKNIDLHNYLFSFNTINSRSGQGFTYNVSLSNRNLILSSSQQLRQSIFNSNDTGIQNRYNKWIDDRQQLSFWYAKPIAERPDYVKDLEEQSNTLEKDLTRSSSTFKDEQNKNEVKWQDIQQNLKPGEAAIEFIDFNFFNGKRYTDSNYYIALLLRKDKPEPVLIKLFEEKQLDSALAGSGKDEYESITNLYGYPKSKSPQKSLYSLIWKPIEKSLEGITKIYFAPSGNLHTIAFAALHTGNNKVLSDKYQLIELNTTASVTDNAPYFLNATDNIQLYGGVKYDADSTALKQAISLYATTEDNIASRSIPDDLERGGKFNYLPGTEAEIESIKQQSTTAGNIKILSGVNATEESFKALNGKASPAVLHIATHGFFFPDPKEERDKTLAKFETSGKVFKQSDNPLFRSGLAFAGANYKWEGKPIEGIEDGILTAYEVSNMYLPNTKLVVLSACQTALGDIQGSEGVYGLQRAFKIAGVKNLVMSLWKVPDETTSEFMQMFYKNLFARQSISDAFYYAQTTMKNKYRDEPYKWAAWILVR